MARLELATSWPPSKRSTKLSYIPTSATVQYTTHRRHCQGAPADTRDLPTASGQPPTTLRAARALLTARGIIKRDGLRPAA